MKFELIVGVYVDDELFDTVPYVVSCEPLARIFARTPEDNDDVSLQIEGLKVVFE